MTTNKRAGTLAWSSLHPFESVLTTAANRFAKERAGACTVLLPKAMGASYHKVRGEVAVESELVLLIDLGPSGTAGPACSAATCSVRWCFPFQVTGCCCSLTIIGRSIGLLSIIARIT